MIRISIYIRFNPVLKEKKNNFHLCDDNNSALYGLNLRIKRREKKPERLIVLFSTNFRSLTNILFSFLGN